MSSIQANDPNFNLIPGEIYRKREEFRERLDSTSLFSAALPLIAVCIWIVFIIINYFTQQQITELLTEERQVDAQIAALQDDRDLNALLVLKTRVLKDIVANDVNPENFFNIVQNLINESGLEINIETYGRNSNGDFFITATANNMTIISDITRIFRNHLKLDSVQLDRATSVGGDSDLIEFELVFRIVE